MRPIVLAIVATVIGFAPSTRADAVPEVDRSLRDLLPLFDKNGCIHVRDLAEQFFCGDPDLHAAAMRLSAAVRDRLNRIPDRLVAVEENVEWTRSRNLSCGIFDWQGIGGQDLQFVKACLLKETEERIAILADPNFDCLATNTTAGLLICSDPALAIAERELNEHVLALTAKLKEDDANAAFSEYARWIRDRDRKCDLDDKDNVPLSELAAEPCLAGYFGRRTAEIIAAKGDAGKVFGRPQLSMSPDADAVDLCVAQIHSANACANFLRVSRVIQLDTEVSDQEALVTAEVEMKILAPFEACSQVAKACSGTCWDAESGQARSTPPATRQNLSVGHRLRVEKSFAFRKTDNSSWRCNTGALQPIEHGVALNSNR